MSALDSIIVGKFHSEYLNLINRYKDLRRNSIFCRYFNINTNASSELNTISINKFGTFDVYDYTPLFHIDTISDSTQDNNQTSGFKFDSEFSLNTYTITTPIINDIVVFPYEGNNKNLIYRVKSVNTNINSLTENVKFHTLNLEYAPLNNINSLKLFNHYVYLITEGKNVTKEFYVKFLNDLNNIKLVLENSEFDENSELYLNFDVNENIVIFKFLNKFEISKFQNYFKCFIFNEDLNSNCNKRSPILNIIFYKFIKPFIEKSLSYIKYQSSINVVNIEKKLLKITTDNKDGIVNFLTDTIITKILKLTDNFSPDYKKIIKEKIVMKLLYGTDNTESDSVKKLFNKYIDKVINPYFFIEINFKIIEYLTEHITYTILNYPKDIIYFVNENDKLKNNKFDIDKDGILMKYGILMMTMTLLVSQQI